MFIGTENADGNDPRVLHPSEMIGIASHDNAPNPRSFPCDMLATFHALR
jgi:hypothetical protein